MPLVSWLSISLVVHGTTRKGQGPHSDWERLPETTGQVVHRGPDSPWARICSLGCFIRG